MISDLCRYICPAVFYLKKTKKVQHATLGDEVVDSPLLKGDVLVSPTNKKVSITNLSAIMLTPLKSKQENI